MAAAIHQRESFPFAGPVLHLDAEGAGSAQLDPVRARRYQHPALAGRTVVCLAGETVAVAEDRLLAFIGFDPAEVDGPLARTPRRGLGYVEWVLINDPDRAGTALALAPEVERAARLAPSRPRAAIRLFEGLAKRLPSAHLPALWEHAGRAFLAADARRWGAAMFERAREAERVYGLRVDRAARDEAHREFALAGGLRTGSVARHVADLRRRRVTSPMPRRSGSSTSCWRFLLRARRPRVSGVAAARRWSAWAPLRRRYGACCSNCSPRRATPATASTAGGWTCWMRLARWMRSSCRPIGCPRSRPLATAPPVGSCASSSIRVGAGGRLARRRSSLGSCHGWPRGSPRTGTRWRPGSSAMVAASWTPTSSTPASSTASPSPIRSTAMRSTCTSWPRAARVRHGVSWSWSPPTPVSSRFWSPRSESSGGVLACVPTTC